MPLHSIEFLDQYGNGLDFSAKSIPINTTCSFGFWANTTDPHSLAIYYGMDMINDGSRFIAEFAYAGTIANWDGNHRTHGWDIVNDGAWHHYAWVFNATADTCRSYFDGVFKASRPHVRSGIATLKNMFSQNSGASLLAKVADPRIYSRAVSDAEVVDWAAYKNPGIPDLTYRWPFTEGSGSAVSESSGNTAYEGALFGVYSWSTDIPLVLQQSDAAGPLRGTRLPLRLNTRLSTRLKS